MALEVARRMTKANNGAAGRDSTKTIPGRATMAPPTHYNWRLQPGATIYASMVYQKNQSRRQPRHHDAANKPHTLVNLNINNEGRRRRPPTATAGATAGEAGTTARVPTATAAAGR
jgi:hypothetical protein